MRFTPLLCTAFSLLCISLALQPQQKHNRAEEAVARRLSSLEEEGQLFFPITASAVTTYQEEYSTEVVWDETRQYEKERVVLLKPACSDSELIVILNIGSIESGADFQFQFRRDPNTRALESAKLRVIWYSDIGLEIGTCLDIGGQAAIVASEAEPAHVIGIDFRVELVREVGSTYSIQSHLVDGKIRFPEAWAAVLWGVAVPPIADEASRPSNGALLLERVGGRAGTPYSSGLVDPIGRRFGMWSTWSPSGRLRVSGEFLAGVRNGLWISYGEDGSLASVGTFLEGLKSGDWVEFGLVKGVQTVARGTYSSSQRVGIWTETWPNGSMRSKGAYVAGKREGLWTRWHSSGAMLSRGTMAGGRPVGPWQFWDEDGTLKTEGERKKFPGSDKSR